MTLLLHCGYHKTASSYLQTCFARNRQLLNQHGIHYPNDPRQKQAARGIPTAGNGAELYDALARGDGSKTRHYLRRYLAEAENLGHHSLLLSAESFFCTFAEPAARRLLLQVANEEGVRAIRALLIFRHPVDHAISVYCHRAPSGKLPPFAQWLEEGFATPKSMDAFADNFRLGGVDWHLCRFQARTDHISQVAFSDWLHIPGALDLSSIPSMVNVSISIAESELLREFHALFPGCSRYLSHRLKMLPRDLKANESQLRGLYERQAVVYFQRHRAMIEKINCLLPPDQALELAPVVPGDETVPPNTFSIAQLVACANGLLDFHQSRTLAGRFKRLVQRSCRKLGRRID
jgi:hypothetical protein